MITPFATPFGFTPNAPANGASPHTHNASAPWSAYSFLAEHSDLNEVSFYVNQVNGSLPAGDVSLGIHADNNGNPGALIGTAVTNGASIAVGKVTFTGLSGLGLSVGTQYWAVLKNLDAAPGTNNFRVVIPAGGTVESALSGSSATTTVAYGWHKRASADSGATWTHSTVLSGGHGVLYGYNTGGTPIYWGSLLIAINTTSAYPIYAARELGVKFTTPAEGKLVMEGCAFFHGGKNNSPTGNLRARLYNGTTLVATSTNAIPNGNMNTSAFWMPFYFAQVELAPSTTYRIVVGETTNADTSANYFYGYQYQFVVDTNVQAQFPFNGSCCLTYFDGTSWADSADRLMPFSLNLRNEQAYKNSSGGGGGLAFPTTGAA